MDLYEKQAGMAAALRMLADDIENGRMPLPYDTIFSVFWGREEDGSLGESLTQADARASMDLTPGGWSKDLASAYPYYRKNYGSGVLFNIHIARADTCKQVVTGQRWVETVPAKPAVTGHYEDVTEWVCE